MNNYKISIIVPIYNAEEDIENAINSILNQTMNLEDIEVIFIDDCSNDNSKNIINNYCIDYPNFKLISLDENIGAAYGPRNIGLDQVTGEFIMFLDSDDCLDNNACNVLYNAISSDDSLDLVFARYCRVYAEENLKLKGYSPYKDNIVCADDLTSGAQFKGLTKFLWKNIINKFFYGSKKQNKKTNLIIQDIKQYPEIFKILPSIWTKIYRTSFIKKYNLKFPSFISGEDLNFVVESYFLARKVLFLNENIVYNYYMRNSSITKNITFPMIYDSLDSYYNVCKICNKYKFKNVHILINPFLLNWISLYKKSSLTNDEKIKLKSIISDFNNIRPKNLVTYFLITLIKFIL